MAKLGRHRQLTPNFDLNSKIQTSVGNFKTQRCDGTGGMPPGVRALAMVTVNYLGSTKTD
jgi:hypothetical protein